MTSREPSASAKLLAEQELARREQHKQRMAWMPWLYFKAKPTERAWAQQWQAEIRQQLEALESVVLDEECFIAPTAHLFAEPGRWVKVGPHSAIAAESFVHGPVTLGAHVSLNARVTLDGGSAGITIGDGTRIATGVHLFAFDHGMLSSSAIRDQPVRSRGIQIGKDVWIGAGAGITDGVAIGDGAVVAMGAVVTHDVAPNTKVAGVPARPIGRRDEL